MTDKTVPLYLGEGPDRTLIGHAKVEVLADGTMLVDAAIDNPTWGDCSLWGFNTERLRGIIPPALRKGD